MGDDMHAMARALFPITRSLTGAGVRQTLVELRRTIPGLQVVEVPTGTQAFDWIVPNEWNIRDAYVADAAGNRVIDFRRNNLHVVSYSEPVDRELELEDLQPHLHSLPDQPDAIPYVVSYYERRWGFCLTHRDRERLARGRYRVVIDSTLAPGHLTYGEVVLPGRESREILLSTYLCHPSLANDNLSGVVVTASLAQWLQTMADRRYTYRLVFIPETLGALVYLSRHLEHLRRSVAAGFVLTCVGDEREYSFIPSRLGGTLADRVALNILRSLPGGFRQYSFRDRGSDERQYCSPGVDLPVASITRSKYRVFPEYHTSKDNLEFITEAGLRGSFEVYRRCLLALEGNARFRCTTLGEPQMGRRGLFPTLSIKGSNSPAIQLMNVLCYCDGQHDLLAIADRLEVSADSLLPIAELLEQHGLIRRLPEGD